MKIAPFVEKREMRTKYQCYRNCFICETEKEAITKNYSYNAEKFHGFQHSSDWMISQSSIPIDIYKTDFF